jgi:NADH:ubiquinone oxidoreductase subunit F (NADH-binding)/NADH:ubiquinone oxidoreductase subunit E
VQIEKHFCAERDVNAIPAPTYRPQILPELQRIQHEYGFLDKTAMEAFSKSSGIPLHRMHAVASFFPHFRTAPPPKVTLHVCRDMACHLAGSADVLRELKQLESKGQFAVHGVSCLGRCDRAPAACVAMHTSGGAETETFYHGRSVSELREIVETALADGATHEQLPAQDLDVEHAFDVTRCEIDPYRGELSDYAAAKACATARAASATRAAETLRTGAKWPAAAADRFKVAAIQRMLVKFAVPPAIADAIREWQTAEGWASTPEMGNWSEAFLKELDDAHADLRGLGGAGIPATTKWRDVRDAIRTARKRRADDRGFIVVNGDESEPATVKDREILLRMPHLVIEGVILAGLLTDATEGFIYIRHEYPEQIEACRREIARAESLGVCGQNATALGRPFPVSVFVSPGGYICGEQSALIEAMSDRRAEPRNMPPKLETNGLDDRPTLVSNVETFAWAPYIINKGGKAYADLGTNGWRGRRLFSVSGDVKRPGVYEVPMGMTLRELLCGDDYCQGVWKDGAPAELKAFAPSGPSGGFLPAKLTPKAGLPRDHVKKKEWQALAKRRGFDPESQELDILDLELELNLFRALSPTQALGAGLTVYAEGRDMAVEAVNAIEFYRNESCGKCVPCRIGSQKLVSLGTNLLEGNIDTEQWTNELYPAAKDLGKVMELTSICGLGRSVSLPLRTTVDYFAQDVARHTESVKPAADVDEMPSLDDLDTELAEAGS